MTESGWATSYCTFQPGAASGNISDAVQWLRAYVEHYSGNQGRIVADFDAYHSYFENVDLRILEMLSGTNIATHLAILCYRDERSYPN